jgi:hypothetical protein
LISLAGTLKAIDNGYLAAGSRVLCCITSGMTEADGRAEPEFVIRDPDILVMEYSRKLFSGYRHARST